MRDSAPAPQRRLYIKTYGCQMNVYDSERMADVLRPLGYALTDEAENADLVVLNTCHIREKASEKVYSELGQIKRMKARKQAAGGAMTIAVAGCVAQAEGAEIMARQPAVDLVIGPQAYHRLPELIARAHRASGERLAADFDAEEKFDALPIERSPSGVTAFLTAWFLAFFRFFLPRTLFEPNSVFKIGYPSEFALGVDTKFQQKYRIWVDRTPDRLFVIYARCTHLGCTPDWKPSENKFKCPCHGSGYDSEGINFEGPAPRPMDRAHLELAPDGQILVDTSKLYSWPKGQPSQFNDTGAFLTGV